MIVDTIKKEMLKYRKEKAHNRVNVLSVILGQIQTLENSKGFKGNVSNDQVIKMIRKIIESNETCMTTIGLDKIRYADLEEENVCLKSLLPEMMTEEEIKAAFVGCANQFVEAKSDGQAIGIGMKNLKLLNKPFDGNQVSKIIKEIRINANCL